MVGVLPDHAMAPGQVRTNYPSCLGHPSLSRSRSVRMVVYDEPAAQWRLATFMARSMRGMYKYIAAMAAVGFPAVSGAWVVTSLHPSGALKSYASGLTQFQQAGIVRYGSTLNACTWAGTAGSLVNLQPSGYLSSGASATTGSQQAGVAQLFTGNRVAAHAGMWSGTAASFVDLHPSGADNSFAAAIVPGLQGGYADLGALGNHASLWSGSAASWVDIHPSGASESWINGMAAGQQVGRATVPFSNHASLWTGSASSWIDLHPAGKLASEAYATDGTIQAGVAWMPNFQYHASVWAGTAGSWSDLNPTGATFSTAYGTYSGLQAGMSTVGGVDRASLWLGTAASWIDLGAFVPSIYTATTANSVWTDGSTTIVAGWGFNSNSGQEEALLWTNVVPEPSALTVMAAGVLAGVFKRRKSR